jgi:hypothetical protein
MEGGESSVDGKRSSLEGQGPFVEGEPIPPAKAVPGSRPRWRVVAGHVTTALAGLLVLFALVAPGDIGLLSPAAFVRVPVDGLLGLALVLVLRGRARRLAAIGVGAALGLLAVLKVVDLGFSGTLNRPFDPVFDWGFLEAATVFLAKSVGRAGAVAAVVAAGLLALAVLALTTLSVVRLTGLAARHRTGAARATVALGVVWAVCAVAGVHVVTGVPVAAHDYYDRVRQVRASLRDQEAFAAEAAVDAYRDTPGARLLTGLRDKDVVVVLIESYGRDAVEDPELAAGVGPVLDAGTARLRAAGYASRSAFVTSPTVGGGSWLAQSTLLSGLWINNQQRYDTLIHSDRLTLNGAFRRAGWRTVGIMPGVILDWPDGVFFDYDRIYAAKDLGYHGPRYSFAAMPDQYTLSAFEGRERSITDRPPLMAVIPLISSHAPWAPIPELVGWDEVGDGTVFEPASGSGDKPDVVWRRDVTQVRTNYRQAIEYSLSSVISYVETYGDDDLVLVFLGDHQPAPVITGQDASPDSPITIVARDPAVLDQVSGWGWSDGLRPGPRSPVWRMDTFRDRFLGAFSSPPASSHPAPR